jgi:hypothetical protein
MISETLVLFGSGPMAIEYSKVLDSLGINYIVKGRGPSSAASFFQVVGREPQFALPVEVCTAKNPAIIAVGEAELAKVCLEAIELGFRKILIEKPGGINPDSVRHLERAARNCGAQVFVAFNRRFFQSAKQAAELVAQDGGATSLTFDFSERSRLIASLTKAPGVKENWLFQNSCHVIDLAIFLSGGFRELTSVVDGGLTWHPSGSQFAGFGKTIQGATFAYSADWDAPGAWSIRIKTPERIIELSPLEICKATNRDGDTVFFNEPPTQALELKPGLMPMIREFLSESPREILMSLDSLVDTLWVYEKISSGTTAQ